MAFGGAVAVSGGMLAPRNVTWLFRISLIGFAMTVAAYVAIVAAIVHPAPAFRHVRAGGEIRFHANTPLPPEVERLGAEISAAFAATPLDLPEGGVDIWLIDEDWRARLFFAGSPRASGLTYPVAAPHSVFLRHTDFTSNRLVRGGRAVPPPRTLTYFLMHEITHLAVAEHVGRFRIARLPLWVNEGFADYVALGPASPAMLARAAQGLPLPRAHYGTYPLERVCVTLAMERLSGDLDAVFAIDAPIGPDGTCPVSAQFGIAPAGVGT